MTAAQLISFARGAPSLDIVDVAGLKAAAARAFDADPAAVTGYGPATGYTPLREWIAKRHDVDVERVLVTNGSLQADAFVFGHFLNPGDDVVVEKPTYDRTLLSLRTLGAKVHQVTLDENGVVVDELRDLLEAGLRPKLAHIIPNFQNPAGVTLSLERRRELIRLAREYEFTIFEDDPYVDIRFRGESLPTMLDLDAEQTAEVGTGGTGGVVVLAGSFTKTVCPGVRVGYLVGPVPTIAAITRVALNTYISPNMLAEATVHQFCVSGDIDRSISTVRAALGERARLLAAALRREIPGARFTEPDGGYFLWVDLPEEIDIERVVPAAAERGVAVVKGTDFLLEGGRHSLRLAYSAVTADQVGEGVRRLAAAIADARG
ncbi:MAG TPA: PLP-dependent aminotransferase family protein [Jiangellales bacterium]|nr:PLP-dependent aminotransferase family protein [Jiangellales bacterium]